MSSLEWFNIWTFSAGIGMFRDGGGDVARRGRLPLVLLHPGPGAGERRPAPPGQLFALQAAEEIPHYRTGTLIIKLQLYTY